ncbi:hypothetical protein [Phytomonospora endophytica]|uniref:Uncharacterized protein n=1 Tax=Phytomonospora endophytica TaxID=714109 RepID=A0A841FH39_9ACTN|nr:hypothetical protein [Phytomonospora endophytica]MBB6033158.1 hypothetical protein [Phytomonospora endophytica]GIG65383.1 hypothetical protein Pen01_16780 [Phytomonospora endophytica]
MDTIGKIMISESGLAHVPQCGHLSWTRPGEQKPKWGWVPDATKEMWNSITTTTPLVATEGDRGLKAERRCSNCYPGMPGDPWV